MAEINNENVGASTPSINRDTTMDIASLIKTAKQEETPAPTVTTPITAPEGDVQEAVKHKTKLEQMMEAKQNQTLGMVVDNDKLNHDENVQLKNKTSDDAISDADKYLADMDAQIDVAKKISFPRPENPQQMVGIMDALDRAAKNPDILKTGEAPAETPTEESKEAVSKDTTAEEKAPETPVEVKDDPEAAKKAEDEKKEELKKQVINILIDKTGMGVDFHFDEEEKAKLKTAEEIHVTEVEDIDLATITVKKPERSFVDTASEYQLSSSRVPVVFPASRFRAYMTGLTYGEMADIAFTHENMNFDKANKRLSIIYNKMADPSCGKFDSYDDFLKKFSFMDMQLAIYGIIIATFPEMDDIGMTCNNSKCGQSFSHKFSPRSLIQFDLCDQRFLDGMKEVIDCPIGKEKELMENSPTMKHKRIRLPDTGLIVEVGFASAYEYLYNGIVDLNDEDKFKDEHPDDLGGALRINAALLSAVRALYVPNDDGSYTMFDKGEDMINILYNVKPNEIRLIVSILDKYATGYSPVFALKDVKCPHCGGVTPIVPIEDLTELVFQKYLRLLNTSLDADSISVL
jgi:hypothetical protein